MDNDLNQRDKSLAILDAMRQWVAEPLERQMASFETQMRDQAELTRNALTAMREDFREAIKENQASLRLVSDPTTGFVPRPEITLLFEKFDQRLSEFIDNAKQRERERAVNLRWAIGTSVGFATAIATAISIIVPLLPHAHP